MTAEQRTAHTPPPWRRKPHEDFLADGDAVGIIGPNDEAVLEIDYGGFSCESDPYGSYPIMVATSENWHLMIAAPELLTALMDLAGCFPPVEETDRMTQFEEALSKARIAIAKAQGEA